MHLSPCESGRKPPDGSPPYILNAVSEIQHLLLVVKKRKHSLMGAAASNPKHHSEQPEGKSVALPPATVNTRWRKGQSHDYDVS